VNSTDWETDYLVIGGGSGGSTAAGVLARHTDATVVLLEAGGTNQRADVTTPSRWHELLGTDATWPYRTTPQTSAGGRVHDLPMGRLLGGSSSVNGMKYMRGGPWDYDRWASMGATGWGSDSVYAVYRQMEDYPQGDQTVHGTGGPIKLTEVTGEHPLTAAFLDACEECGYIRTFDFNGSDAEGFGLNQLNMWDGLREDAATLFLDQGRVQVVLGTTATRLVLDASGSRVVAVEVVHDGVARTITVNREVVLAAGAIASPQLLMLSGIGPADHLRGLGIEVRHDLLGVGQNFHDHLGVPVVFESAREISPTKYQATEVSLYLRADDSSEHFDTQVAMHQFAAYLPPEDYSVSGAAFTFFPGILKPRSRGSVTLTSSDPADQPRIDPAYLSDPRDLASLVRLIGVVRDLAATSAFAPWCGREVGPGPDVTSEEQLAKYVRRLCTTYYHPAGTCRMGTDDQSVTDAQLRVHGVENLRVADASVMPEIVSGNTNAPAMMIGWRAAELILG
jgi:choline dehydrogenase